VVGPDVFSGDSGTPNSEKKFLNGRKRNGWRIMTSGNGEKVMLKMNQVRDCVVVLQDSSLLTLQ